MKLSTLAISGCLFFACPLKSLEASFFDSIKRTFFGTDKRELPAIRVLLCYNQPSVAVEVRGSYQLFDPNTGDSIGTRFIGKGQYVRPISGGLKWGEEFPGIYQLKISPDPETRLFVAGKSYRGDLYLYQIADTINIVNEVSVEDFLDSSLKASVEDSFHEEALAAIAIAARTLSYYRALHPANRFWAVDGAMSSYHGIVPKRSPTTPMQRAIAATRHMVLSTTSAYEKQITPFPAKWEADDKEEGCVTSVISLAEVQRLARQGYNAAQILAKAFPDSSIAIASSFSSAERR